MDSDNLEAELDVLKDLDVSDVISDYVLMGMSPEKYNEIFDESLTPKCSRKRTFEACISLGFFNEIIAEEDKKKRKPKILRNRVQAWEFINSWSNSLFYRQLLGNKFARFL